ncbi:MAG: co-chaperone GroES [Hydrotalea sp. AMD]|uniref:co-chaperone GroES n=1 Tax=Hydrotalea sp. AMD TaxID=2501297 RepID=UPI001025A177|nr:co-chaperone GroES [Hydrotalea sp. AMD]RWZ87182.1 MAG: co-chaperone GroES [Hydrotalea sp. AMD]
MSKIIPILDRIAVKRDDEKEVSAGGIILSGSAVEKPYEGTVVAVGGGKYTDKGELMPMHLKAGDRIVFGKYAGTEVTVSNEKFIIMKEEEILGILS